MSHVSRASRPRARSYNVISEPGKLDVECDSFKCGHCQKIVFCPVNEIEQAAFALWTVPSYHCPMCSSYVCAGCAEEMAKTHKCVPFEARLDARESRRAFLEVALSRERAEEIAAQRARQQDEIESRIVLDEAARERIKRGAGKVLVFLGTSSCGE